MDGKCPIHASSPEWIEEKNWFFRLSAYQDPLLELYDARPTSSTPVPLQRGAQLHRRRSPGLLDLPRRTAVGCSDPVGPEQVAYVWADALVNYLSALTYARPGDDLRGRYWPAVRHLLGKDILRFHCVYWPAMLLAAGYDVPHAALRPRLPAPRRAEDLEVARQRRRPAGSHRRLRRRSRALLVCPRRLVRSGRQRVDRRLHERYERELGNDLGNLLSRTTAMIARYLGGAFAAAAERGLGGRAL